MKYAPFHVLLIFHTERIQTLPDAAAAESGLEINDAAQ